tara:strand:- start:692 stop:1927 length:1236 start_codon:yes stop_codon:yes gene_type:complete
MRNIIKKKVISLKPSATLAINERCKELIAQGKKIYRFGFGQSPFPVPEKIVEVLKRNAHRKDYLSIQGLPELRQAIATHLNKKTKNTFSKENVLVTPGSKEAMYLMHVVFDGEIILPSSSWVSYAPQAELANNKTHWLQTSYENNWFPTAQALEKKIKSIKSNKILLILNSPNNPSGTICNNFKELAQVARENKIIILSDEIYTDITFNNRYESISTYYPEGTLISGGLSKWCGAGGWRLGFLAAPSELHDFLINVKAVASETYSTVNTPVQYAAVEAYNGDYEDYKFKVRNILNSVGQYVYKKLKSNKIFMNPPQGGLYVMPEFMNSKFKSSAELCDVILKDTGVAMLPGSDFGFKKDKMVTRLSFTDFDGKKFLEGINTHNQLEDEVIEKYAPNVVKGIEELSKWSKNL